MFLPTKDTSDPLSSETTIVANTKAGTMVELRATSEVEVVLSSLVTYVDIFTFP